MFIYALIQNAILRVFWKKNCGLSLMRRRWNIYRNNLILRNFPWPVKILCIVLTPDKHTDFHVNVNIVPDVFLLHFKKLPDIVWSVCLVRNYSKWKRMEKNGKEWKKSSLLWNRTRNQHCVSFLISVHYIWHTPRSGPIIARKMSKFT